MIQKIDLKDRIAILTEENICDLLHLYGELNIDRLSQIVNNHIRVAIDEIKGGFKMIKDLRGKAVAGRIFFIKR